MYLNLFQSNYRWLLTGLFMLMINVCCAQQKVADSLVKVLKKQQQQDTAYLSALIKISSTYAADDHAEGIVYADKAIVLARQLNNQLLLARAYHARAANVLFDNVKAARDNELESLKIVTALNNKHGIAVAYITLSSLSKSLADYVKGLEYAKKAIYESEQIGDRRLVALGTFNLGTSYSFLGDYPTAISCYFKSLKYYESVGDKSNITKAVSNIGYVYYNLKRYSEALVYYNKALDMWTGLNNKVFIALELNNIGDLYLDTHDYVKAVDYNKKALSINTALNVKKGIGNNLMSLGVAYGYLGKYPDAFDYLNKAINIYNELGAKSNTTWALGYLATMYCMAPAKALIEQGIDPSQRFSTALQVQQKAIQLAQEIKDLNNEGDQWKSLTGIYEKQHNYQQALNSYRTYSKIRDSVYNGSKRRQMELSAMQYDFDQKQAKAEAELARQKVIKNAAIVIGLILLVAAIMVFVFYKRRKDARERQKYAEFKVNVAETELKALRSQLNPHFIFNSLNSISDYIARHEKDIADDYLAKFAHLMRMILESSESETISLADDIKVLELYMQLEVLRLGHKFLYEISIDEQVDAENTMVPPMLLQPFVENSIWHGMGPKNGNGNIMISVKKQGEMITYMVEDNGVGRDKAKSLTNAGNGIHKRSFGIKVIQSRIDILNQIKKTNARVDITDLEEGTRVTLTLPLDLEF